MNLVGSYNYALVALSVLIAMFASYAALDLAGRVTASRGWTRAGWLLGGAGAMGTGIWSMHYIGMLAFILPVPVAYHWPTVLLSLFAAIIASVIALYVVSRQKMGALRALAGSVLMGAGIASMHYIGMAAMRLPAICEFNFGLVVLSVVVAVLISLAALWITFQFRDEKTGIGWEKLAGALVMGAGIPVMHYTGMAAASFTASLMPADLSHAVSISTLGTAGIAAVTFIVLGLALLTSSVDRRLATQTMKIQEEELRQSEAYLSEAQRLSHTGSWASIPSMGEIRYMSEECYRVLGFDPQGGQPGYEMFFQNIHPDDQAKVKEAVETAGRENAEFELDYRIVHPGGEIRDIHVLGHPVPSATGNFVEFVGTVIDITERKQAEEKLRQSEAYLNESQRLGHIGSWAYNVSSGELFASPEFLRIFGRDPDQEKPTVEMFRGNVHPEDRAFVDETIDKAMREKTDFALDHRIVLPDGSIRHVYSMAHRVFDDSDTLVEYIGTVLDVTDRKRAEEALRRAQADLAHVNRVTTMGELTASLAHEVNQPIAAAITNANTCLRWLTRDHPNLEEAREAAMRIVKDGTRAAEIVSRIRQIFKKGAPERDLVDVNDVIWEMILLLRGEATKHHILFRTELAADLPKVMGDRVQLQQVVMNLIVNSIEAMKDVDEKREVVLKSQRAENEHITVSVSDTGMGLPPQQEDQIFDAFFTTKPHGTGMGLRICRSIVELHGGRLWATDNNGRGATFQFTLPIMVGAREMPAYGADNSLIT